MSNPFISVILSAVLLLSGCASPANRAALAEQQARCKQGIETACLAAAHQDRANQVEVSDNALKILGAVLLIPAALVATAAELIAQALDSLEKRPPVTAGAPVQPIGWVEELATSSARHTHPMLKTPISVILSVALLLSGCASPANRAALAEQQEACKQGVGNACQIAARQEQINSAEASENTLKVIGAVLLIPLVIIAAAAGAEANRQPDIVIINRPHHRHW